MKLIRGAPGAGKTRQVFREFKDALGSGGADLRIVVPTATLVRHFQHELARDGMVFSPRSVLSLDRLIRERAIGTNLVPNGLLRAIVRDSLERLQLPEFAAVSATEGMVATIVESIDLFEKAGSTPDKLATVRKLGPLARAFEKLWRSVAEAVHRSGYSLRGDFIRSSAANTQPARIWLDGFLNFTPLEQEFLRALVKVCDVTLTITDFPGTDEIRKFALRLGAQDQLLPGKPRKPRTILVTARSVEREADEIARRILSLREYGTEFRRMGVALPEGATYESLLRSTFDRFGIPARFYLSSPLPGHPAARFLGGLISGALGGWDFEAALDTLRAHPRWGASGDFDRFDFAVREVMPGHGAEQLLALCQSDRLGQQIAPCFATDAWKTLQLKPAEWQKRFADLAATLYRPGTLDIAHDHAGVEAARSHVAALRTWVKAIESITAFWSDPDSAIPLEEFWRVASLAVEGATIQSPDDRASVVHVMNAWEARQWDVASLFVCGMTDRNFPRPPPQNLLFSDSDIDRLRAAGIPFRKAADYECEECWLFDSLRTRAADSLVLSYPEHDAAGKSVERSRLIDFHQHAEPAPLSRPLERTPLPAAAVAGRVASPDLQREMARLHQSISLTALEDLAQCRFRFFAGRTLALKAAPERPEKRLHARVTGSILHIALERWLADKGRDFVEVFEAVFEEICRVEHIPAGYRLEVDRTAYREIARRVSANDLWTPDSSEVEVPLTIEFPGGIRVTCRVDRVDRFGSDCVIVDYKSSKTARVEKLVTSPTRLQGPLYALAVRENLRLNPIAMVFWAVRDDERYGWGKIPGIDLEYQPMPENWTTDARLRTIERLSGFLAGAVDAHPEEADTCRWCDFAAACRVEQEALVQIGFSAAGINNAA